MNKDKQKKLFAKWVNVTQILEGKDKETYIVLKPPPMNYPVELDYSIYPKIKKDELDDPDKINS